jgi:hypothetical protein
MEENCVLTPNNGLHPHGVNYSGLPNRNPGFRSLYNGLPDIFSDYYMLVYSH